MLSKILARVALVGAVAAIGAPGVAVAATVAERSPFTQGQWWDPTRSGNGFELFNVGDEGMALWFTFDDARNPIWYTAQGEIGTTWTVLKHQWGGVQRGAVVPVGTLKLTFRDDSQADADFTLLGRTGTWRIEPFTPGARSNEIDHSGSYYNPANPGWGFTLTEQGEVLGGVLYYYDANGFPTWVAGFARGSTGSVGVVGVRGSCPGCEPGPTDRFDGGRIDIEMLAENQAVLRAVLTNPAARGLEIDGARLVQLGRAASQRVADRLPASFPSAASLKAYLERVMPNMAFGQQPYVGGVPPLGGPESPVRFQDSGANECDSVQSSASHVYTLGHDGSTRPMAHIRIAQVGGDGRALDVRSEIVPLASGFNTPTYAAALCLGTDALVSIAGTQPYHSVGSSTGYMKGRTYVEIFGLADPARPASRWWAEFEGHVLTSFRIGQRLYLVLRYAPTVQGLDYRYLPSSEAANREVLAAAPLSLLTPQVRPSGGAPVALVAPASTYLAPQGSRRGVSHVAVVAIDLNEARIVDSLAIVGTVEQVQLSGSDLYLAGTSVPGAGMGAPQGTRIYHVRLGAQGLALAGTGLVDGVVSRDGMQARTDGQLRVVSAMTAGARLTILEPGVSTPGFLRALAALPNASFPTPLPGAWIVRFGGDRLYLASTFELGVVDLSDAREPKLAGVLTTRGALESLHPLPDGRLIATGHEVGFFGIRSDLHITLYDARDATKLREVQRVRVGSSAASTPLWQEPYAFAVAHAQTARSSLAFPALLPPPAPGIQGGMVHFELRDPASFNAGLRRFPDLFGAGASPQPGARAILFPEAVIYVSAGQVLAPGRHRQRHRSVLDRRRSRAGGNPAAGFPRPRE